MTTTTRKQRERIDREQRILDVARRLLIDEGYHGLTMDRIAEALEYSKGTIYNHFGCKEEIMLALAVSTMETRSALFAKAASFSGRPRDRFLAIRAASEIFVGLFPDHFRVEQVIRSDSMWEKTSEQRRNALRGCEHRCMAIVAGIVRDAVAQQDLVLPPDLSPEDLVFGLWSMSNGAFLLIDAGDSLRDVGIRDPRTALRRNQDRLLDGYGWKPLSGEMDQEGIDRRIQTEIFADEYRKLAAAR